MIDIAITSRQNLLSIDTELLAEACRRIVAGAGHSQAALSVTLVEDDEMHELNRQHLDHDYPTDVLSFPLSEPGQPLEGEIIASTGTATSNAQEYGNRPEEELLLYVVHGTLHLVGLDDKTADAAKKMRAAEAYWLTDLGIPDDRARALVYPSEPTTCDGEPTR
ncbi:rRNA maturation RNase YbeY [Aeoliella sp. ICT_H6.2]|uniref:Endoribonuclease YbeY n=1 Tax=Aeoliella straminimaris TaxID=2954799 RepID=A0A9X2FAD4_9BACT|nr:rRNA maturation RNase YbeY [Aeoliella straminimaris]MCO6042351.1 rRNA maturation RNase YbeY [Aeoliella straminimaris]